MWGQSSTDGQAIVVGTDGSASANEAVKQAATLARARGAALHIVNAYRHASRAEIAQTQARFRREFGYAQMGTFEIDGIGDQYAIAIEVLEDAAHLVEYPDLHIFLHAVNAEAHKALRWVAEQKNAAMIVVGNKPAKSFLHPLRRPLYEELELTVKCQVKVVDTSAHWAGQRSRRALRGQTAKA